MPATAARTSGLLNSVLALMLLAAAGAQFAGQHGQAGLVPTMKSFFSVLSRNAGTLLLSLAIIAGLSYYLLSYVPERTASLNARYFRVLARVGYNVKEKIKAQYLNDEGNARSIAYLLSYQKSAFWKTMRQQGALPSDTSLVSLIAAVNQIFADRPGPDKYHLRPACDTSTYKYSRHLAENEFAFGYIVPPAPVVGARNWRTGLRVASPQAGAAKAGTKCGGQLTYELTHTIPVDTLVRELRRPDVFDYFCVVELPSHRLLYSSGPTDFYLASTTDGKAGKRLPRWLADSSATHTGWAGAFAFGGQQYQLFAQPVQLGPRLTCLLVGGVAGHRFNTERRALPLGWPELVVGILLLGVLALPFLKLWLMSPREQISRRDVVLSAASLVLGSGILLLTLQAAVARRETASLVKQHLAALATEVATNLHKELARLNILAREVDWVTRYNFKKPAADTASALTTIKLAEVGSKEEIAALIDSARSRGHAGGSDYLTWVRRDGRALYGLNLAAPDDTAQAHRNTRPRQHRPAAAPEDTLQAHPDALTQTLQDCLPSLAGRKYLRKLNEGVYHQVSSDRWPPNGNRDSCYFEMLRIVQSVSPLRAAAVVGKREIPLLKAILARPSKWNSDLVAVFETELACFKGRVTPPGYGFCLMGPDGEVMAHSDPHLNLSENLLQDCEPSSELEALLYAQQPGQALEVIYQGRPTLLHVYPLAGMQCYLITFFDMSHAKAQQSQASLLALTLLGGFWLLAAALTLLGWLGLRPGQPRPRRDRFRSWWPRAAYAGRYWQVVASQLLGLWALGLVAGQVGPLSQLCLLVIAPLLLFGLMYRATRLRAAGQPTGKWWVAGLVGGLLLGLLWLYGWVLPGPEVRWVAGFTLGLGGWISGLLWWQERGRRFPPPAIAGTYRAAYVAMLLGWIGLLGLVPALRCYQVAHLVEQVQQVRAGQLGILKAYAQRTQQRDNRLITIGLRRDTLFFNHTNFFFKSTFQPKADLAAFANLGPVDTAALRFFAYLRQPLATTEVEAGKVLVVDPTAPDAQWQRWHITSLAGSSLTVNTQDKVGNSQVVSKIGGLLPGGSGAAIRAALLTGLQWLLMLGGLWALVSYLLRRLFGLSEPVRARPVLAAPVAVPVADLPSWPQRLRAAWVAFFRRLPSWLTGASVRATAPSSFQVPLAAPGSKIKASGNQPAPAAPEWRFWLLPAGSTWADVPAWAKPQAGPPDAMQLFDCRQYKDMPEAAWQQVLAALPGPPASAPAVPPASVLASFDCYPTDADLTNRKTALLNALQQRGWPLVILSASHPDVFSECGHPLEKPCPDDGHRPMRQAGEQLLSALAEFRMEYFSLHSAAPTPVPVDVATQLFKDEPFLKVFFEHECQAFPFVASLRPLLLAKLWQQRQASHGIEYGTIETAVQRMAQFNFRRLWLALSPQEKFLLFDLAQDGLVNTDNALALDILLQKGFLQRASNGRLRLRSASFQGFILTAQRQREAMQYVAASEQGTWAATQTPLLLLLAAGALFMFITQPTTFTQTQTFLVGLTSLVPALVGLIKLLLTPKPTASAAAS